MKHTTFSKRFSKPEIMTISEYLERCKTDPMAYANTAERMLEAIGAPVIVDTSEDPRLSRIHSNRKIRTYPKAFGDFYGAEEAIERIVTYFRNNAVSLEESKQILYLLGPVGGGKSSLVERIKELICKNPIYVLYDPNEADDEFKMSPVFESPFGIFDKSEDGPWLEKEFGIPRARLNTVPSGWALQKLEEFDGDVTKFSVAKFYPNKERQMGVIKVEPGDENNQDVSVLIGKTDLRKLHKFGQSHPYSYAYSGGLCRSNQGILDFAEMFKASIKTLNPLLTATQERNYQGTESIPANPYNGIVVAHSNESEWQAFKNNKTNEAFLDRVYIVNVPYCLRFDDEIHIYEKMLSSSSLVNVPIAPYTLKFLAQFMVMTRLKDTENSSIQAKLHVYNGDMIRDKMPNAKPIEEYRQAAGISEGMSGMSTRFAFKLLSQVFDLRPEERQANPVDLMFVIEEALRREAMDEKELTRVRNMIRDFLRPQYFEFLEKELRTAYLDSFDSFGQNMFNRYVMFAEAWIEESPCRDPDTHVTLSMEKLNNALEEIEKPSSIVNAKDFRNDIVRYAMRYKASHQGESPKWNNYEKIKTVIERKMFGATENIMPVIAFGAKQDEELAEKHNKFLTRMKASGYTENQTKILVAWWSSNKKSS